MHQPLALLLLFTAAAEPSVGEVTFEKQVRPILKAYCFECHGEGDKLKADLDLRLRRLIVKGGESGPAVQPGSLDDSLLYKLVQRGKMPPTKKKLSRDEVALISRWIATGAKTAAPEPENLAAGLQITPEERAFWAFQPMARPAVPTVAHAERVRTPIDAFLLARLEAQGLTFAAEADRRTLVRRVYFDLLGLPPTPAVADAFVNDPAPDAYEKLIDQLLASPHYGERWGRHWLDVAGYADSDGYASEDIVRPYAYKYRDYVIRAFDADKPFDQFIVEQLAGDELLRPPYRNLSADDVDKLIATGFLRMAPDGTGAGGVDPGLARNAVVADTIKIVSTSLLGLTVGCAQCHNHRYDPIPQSDYYRLRALLEPAYNVKQWRSPAQRLISLATDADHARSVAVEAEAVRIDQQRLKKQQEYIDQTFNKELAKLPEELREPIRTARTTPLDKRTPEQQKLLMDHPSVNVDAGSLYLYDHNAAEDLKSYAARAAAVREMKPVEDFVQALTEMPGEVPTTHVFHRGDHEQPKQAVEPGGLVILEPALGLTIAPDSARPTTGRRLALARWLTNGRHPLTARVLVNRFWMHHFGRGIVGTPADFGMLGERPTHPELLDWLAHDFIDHGWRLKRFHKLLMTSTAYRQLSRRDAAKERLDPDNRLVGRMPVRRLEAEALRDAVLAVSGRLNRKMFGPPLPVRVDLVGQVVLGIDKDDLALPTGKFQSLNGEEFRRSVYVQVRRSRTLSLFETFDAAVMEPNCEIRNASTVAPQSLLMMNSNFVIEEADAFAERLRKEAGADPQAQVQLAWRLAFAREPAPRDVEDAVAFLAMQAENLSEKAAKAKKDARQLALANWCQALLSANRFLYVD
jgi:cytochrome c553